MKKIESMYDLREYGFDVLTGEACKINCRLLVDLDFKGLEIYCNAYGLICPSAKELIDKKHSFREGRNGGVASVLIGRGDLSGWQLLGVLAFWRDQVITKIITTRLDCGRLIIYGLEKGEEEIKNAGRFDGRVVDKEYETERDRLEYAASWRDNWIFRASEEGEWKAWNEKSMGVIKNIFRKVR